MPGTETETMRIRCVIIAWMGGSHRCLPLLAAACAWVLLLHILSTPALAKEFERPIKIGVLSPFWENSTHVNGLREGLEILGYRENIDFVIGIRFTSGDLEALPLAARELMEMEPDLLFTDHHMAALAVKNYRAHTPLVFISIYDPVEIGLVKSFAHPGGNSTGLTPLFSKFHPKVLEFYTRILPGKKRFLFLSSYSQEYGMGKLSDRILKNLNQAGRHLNIDLDMKFVSNKEEARRLLGAVRRKDVDAILTPLISHNLFGYSLKASQKEKIPLMTTFPFATEQGALASYGVDWHVLGRQSARLMDKIFRGEDPGKIPVEVTDQMKLVINLKVAKELGITIPSEMLFRADRIIR